MGRNRTPTALKEMAGTAQPCRMNPAEPRPERALLIPPHDLPAAALPHWRRLAPIIHDLGVLTVADGEALRSLCECIAQIRSLNKQLADYGSWTYIVVTDKGGRVVRAYPEVAMLAELERRLLAYWSRFGLTPADRSKVSAAPDAGEAADPWDMLAAGPGEGAGRVAN